MRWHKRSRPAGVKRALRWTRSLRESGFAWQLHTPLGGFTHWWTLSATSMGTTSSRRLRRRYRPRCPMSAPVEVAPELKALLRRVKLGRCLDTLPERLALARTGGVGHAE